MSTIATAYRVLKFVASHESGKGKPWQPVIRFLSWQLRKRIHPEPMLLDAFGSARLKCYPNRTSSSAVVYHGWPDWHEMHLLARLLRPGDGFLDVGANVGVYSVLAATKLLPGGRVMAFEPEPEVADILVENFLLNGIDADEVHRSAVGETSGECVFVMGRDAQGQIADEHETGQRVPITTLDAAVTEADEFVVGKIDIEGHEVAAFKGATQLLKKHRPICWLIETNDCADRTELHGMLKSAGYEFFEILVEGAHLRRVPQGGAYPDNCLVTCDLDWVRGRIPGIRIDD